MSQFEPKQARFTFAYSTFAQLSLKDQMLAKIDSSFISN